MHQQAAQKSTKLLQVFTVLSAKFIIVAMIVTVIEVLTRGNFVIHAVKADGHTDQNGGHRQRIKKGRQQGGGDTEQKRQQRFGANTKQNLGEGKQQQVFHKVDACHHKDQQ